MEPWGTAANTGTRVDVFLVEFTLWYLLFRKDCNSLSGIPLIPPHCILYISQPCHPCQGGYINLYNPSDITWWVTSKGCKNAMDNRKKVILPGLPWSESRLV